MCMWCAWADEKIVCVYVCVRSPQCTDRQDNQVYVCPFLRAHGQTMQCTHMCVGRLCVCVCVHLCVFIWAARPHWPYAMPIPWGFPEPC